MSLVRFDPFDLVRDLDRLFESPTLRTRTETWLPRVDVFDRDADLVVRAEVPGTDAESLDVTVEGGTLTISGSRSFESETGGFHRKEIFEGRFTRTVRLPKGIDHESITATSKDGILEVTVPKRPEVLPRKVAIEVQR